MGSGVARRRYTPGNVEHQLDERNLPPHPGRAGARPSQEQAQVVGLFSLLLYLQLPQLDVQIAHLVILERAVQ